MVEGAGKRARDSSSSACEVEDSRRSDPSLGPKARESVFTVCTAPARNEVLEGLKSLETSNNDLDVTSLLVKRKRKTRAESPDKENHLQVLPPSEVPLRWPQEAALAVGFSRTQPPPGISPPPGLEDGPLVTPDSAHVIDALVQTLSQVLSRSLSQDKAALSWEEDHTEEQRRENKHIDVPATICRPIKSQAPQPPSRAAMQAQVNAAASDAEVSRFVTAPYGYPGGGRLTAYPSFTQGSQASGYPADYLSSGEWPRSFTTMDEYLLRTTSANASTSNGRLVPPQFLPLQNPFAPTGLEHQFCVGGYPLPEWRRFFIYLATLDSHALVAYLTSQNIAWYLDQQQRAMNASGQPLVTYGAVTVPVSSSPPSAPPVSPIPVYVALSSPPPPPTAQVPSRIRAHSRPWRRHEIPPPSEGRFKQIARAKATPEYLLYADKIPKDNRDPLYDPMTPRVEGTTWREFQQDVRSWKRLLHRKAEILRS